MGPLVFATHTASPPLAAGTFTDFRLVLASIRCTVAKVFAPIEVAGFFAVVHTFTFMVVVVAVVISSDFALLIG
mgnify:CR=1 FL=1